MPRSIKDPFYIAKEASGVRSSANRSYYDMAFLSAYYAESGLPLNDCEITTATYLAWYESLLRSGVRFEEHAAKLGMFNCKMDQTLVDLFMTQKEEDLRERVEYALEQEQEQKTKKLIVGSLGVGFLGISLAFILRRRHSLRASNDRKASGK